jgi:hypothetical protein
MERFVSHTTACRFHLKTLLKCCVLFRVFETMEIFLYLLIVILLQYICVTVVQLIVILSKFLFTNEYTSDCGKRILKFTLK